MYDLKMIQGVLDATFPGHIGVRLVEATPERVVAELDVRPSVTTTGGILHGGACMSLADTLGAVGTFLNLPPGATTTTVDSSTHFMAAAKAGTKVRGECVPLHRGRTTMVW
jgi:uncharacterized protein (TIGR00369 family)